MSFSQQALIYAGSLVAAFGVSVAFTAAVRRLALRWGVLDHPGGRKLHRDPMPLMGGVAMVGTFYLFVLLHLVLLLLRDRIGWGWLGPWDFFEESARHRLIGFALGGLVIFVLGVVDDLRPLGPLVKLLGQTAAALILILFGMSLSVFLDNAWLSAAVTLVWVVLMINSLNFLDNMDGLCGGVSIIAAFSFFLCLQPFPYDDHLLRWLLMVFAGAMGGFLYHNLSPARIFMGDAGSMFSGYFLASVAIMGTFHVAGTPSRIAIAAPLLALAVPLFDTLSVIWIRLRVGHPIMRGDQRHFSHRLVDLGMSPRQAVYFIFLVAGVVGLGGALLPLMDLKGTFIILGQTAGVFLLIVLLMSAGKKGNGTNGGQ